MTVPVGGDDSAAVAAKGQKYCHACGGLLDARAVVCPKCGVAQPATHGVGRRSRITAVLFALFLGGIGAHKFYLGRTGQGVVYLVFFWTLIPAVVALVEGLIYLSMSDERFAEKYG